MQLARIMEELTGRKHHCSMILGNTSTVKVVFM